eukprot:m.413529 g.413529  ORF g.413529 m.413529 type:complete len:129 (+) comp56582_c0_seq3:1217-1603(+)
MIEYDDELYYSSDHLLPIVNDTCNLNNTNSERTSTETPAPPTLTRYVRIIQGSECLRPMSDLYSQIVVHDAHGHNIAQGKLCAAGTDDWIPDSGTRPLRCIPGWRGGSARPSNCSELPALWGIEFHAN